MASLMKSLSCRGSTSISISGSGGSHSGKKPREKIDLRDMKEEEEDLPFAQYFEKRGLADMLKRFVAKLGRRNKMEKEKSQTTV